MVMVFGDIFVNSVWFLHAMKDQWKCVVGF